MTGLIEFISTTTGTSSGANIGLPIDTRAATTIPSSLIGTISLIPARVSTCSFPSVLGTIPLSSEYLAKHLIPLPHISPSDPSELNIRIFKSAISEVWIKIIPSLPTPKCLLLISMARRPQSFSI